MIAREVVTKHVLIVTIMSAYYDCAFMIILPLRDTTWQRCQTALHHAAPLSLTKYFREKSSSVLYAQGYAANRKISLYRAAEVFGRENLYRHALHKDKIKPHHME